VSIPSDLLDEDDPAIVGPPPSVIRRDAVAGGLAELVDALVDAEPGTVAVVAGDEVAASGALQELEAVAELLGAPVFGSPLHGRRVFSPTHPLWAGMLPPEAARIRDRLGPYRRVVVVGGQAFMVYPYSPGSPLPDGADLLHLAPGPVWLGRAHPTTLGLSGDLKATLAALAPRLRARTELRAATSAIAAAKARRDEERAALEETALGRYDDVPLQPMAAAHALVRALPPESIVVDEAITTGFYVRGFHHTTGVHTYWFCKGGGLGWGMPAAVGISLGRDREPVLCVVGDGSALYSPQALWTAAHEGVPVVFAVVDNNQ